MEGGRKGGRGGLIIGELLLLFQPEEGKVVPRECLLSGQPCSLQEPDTQHGGDTVGGYFSIPKVWTLSCLWLIHP